MTSLKLSLANKAVSVVAVMMVVMASLSVVNAATSCCGTSAHLDRNVGESTSQPVTAYYFYNNSYAPDVFITSDNIQCPIQFSYFNNNQSLTINGIVDSISNSTSGFFFVYQFKAESTYNPLLELQPNQYVQNGGTVDPRQWSFWSLTEGTLAGYGSYQGVSLSISEFMHPLQIGRGANGKNLNYGAGGWFSFINAKGELIQTDLNVDVTCNGNNNNSSNSNCDATTTCSSHGACSADGSCYCYTGYTGSACNQCATGYSGYPNCASICDATTTCSSHGTCAADGSCVCNVGYTGASCNQCSSGYSGYPSCVANNNNSSNSNCDATTTCSSHGACSADGSCYCYTGYAGSACNQCATGYSGYPNCASICDAATTCSSHGTCAADGSCVCNAGYTGASCNQCSSGFYNYPSCVVCNAATTCSSYGTCAADGSCVCNVGYTGASCNQCSAGYSGYPSCTSLTGGLVNTPSATPTNGANVQSVGYIAAATVVAAVLFA